MNKLLKQYLHWLLFILFLIFGALVINSLNQDFLENELERRNQKLAYQHETTVKEFTNSIDKFAGLVSGMRAYMNLSPTLPAAEEFQKFVQNQFQGIRSKDSIVVSIVDTLHVFKQSFTRNTMNPANLVGTSVGKLRSQEKIAQLDALLKQDSIMVFAPINLFEGWVGLPINFRVKQKNVVYGYVAAIIDFKSVVRPIYDFPESDEFIYQFKDANDLDIDRYKAYNDTKVYHDEADPEYYKNFNRPETEFLFTTKSYYGYTFKIGTAYKHAYAGNASYTRILIFWYVTFALLAFIVAMQMSGIKRLTRKVMRTNKLLKSSREEIQLQNINLTKLTKTQNKFFKIIGHDIKQPLNSIEGFLYLLEDEEIPDPSLASIISDLKGATSNTVSLLNNLLRWAMSQSGDIKFNPATLDMDELIHSELTVLAAMATDKNIQLHAEIQKPLEYVGDSDMIRTIVRNLVSNALKFTSAGGQVVISAERKGHTLFVKVSDTGIGMTKADSDSLFQIGRQVSTVGTFGETGTGLGLVLCSDFAKKHGGNITVKSKVGEGTEFTVQLPYAIDRIS